MKRKILTISLIISFSVLLWIFVSFSGEFSITLNLPIQVVEIPTEHSISSVSSNNVSISLKGQGWQLAQHTMGRDPKFFIPSPKVVGEKEISSRNVLGLNSWLSTSLQLAEISPEKIKVKVEKTISKKVAIIPVVALSFKSGYGLVSQVKIEPDSVEITGPESIINDMTILNTKSKALSNLESSESIILELDKRRFVNISAEECNVSFDVQKIVDKTFEDLQIETRNIPSRYELMLSPQKVTVVLRGGISQLSKMKNDDVKALVKFDQAINDTVGSIEPTIEFPEFTSIVDVKPNRLEYIIKKY